MKINSPDVVRRAILDISSRLKDVAIESLTDRHKGFLLGIMTKALTFDSDLSERHHMTPDALRRMVIGWLFWDVSLPYEGQMSSKLLSPAQWVSLRRWIFGRESKDDPRPEFKAEIRWVLERALFDYVYTVLQKENGVEFPFGRCLERWASRVKIVEADRESMVADVFNLGGVVVVVDEKPDTTQTFRQIMYETEVEF